jgi:hypothetical protein
VSAPEGAPPALDWAGPSPWTADGLLTAAARARPAVRPRDRARHFLTAFLKGGPRTTRQVWEAARHERLTRRTLRRAKGELDIRSARVWAGGRRLSYWLLPGQPLPPGAAPEAAPPDLEEWLAPLREQYPPSTPLDDL